MSIRSFPAPLASEELAEVVKSAGAGDRRAWEVLMREFGGTLTAIARAHGLRGADVEDVSQATWLKLIEHIDQIRDPARIGGWLATTARRQCLRLLSSNNRHVLLSGDEPQSEEHESPDQAILAADRDVALWHGFTRLRPTDRNLLRLLTDDPTPSYEQISSALGMPVGSIGPTRARALGRLRSELVSDGSLDLLAA
jgi:RNA polymerase sigma factor (sigma-70 family)